MTDSLPDILELIWDALHKGATDRRHPFHLPTLATRGASDFPEARIVVLRRAERDARQLVCHTDARSGKVREIAADSRVTWLFYDPEMRHQFRVRAHAEVVEEGPLFEDAWKRSDVSARRCYLAPRAPSSVSDVPTANLPDSHVDRNPNQEESEAGKVNFSVVRSEIISIERLHLASDGHRRVRFDFVEGAWQGVWIEP